MNKPQHSLEQKCPALFGALLLKGFWQNLHMKFLFCFSGRPASLHFEEQNKALGPKAINPFSQILQLTSLDLNMNPLWPFLYCVFLRFSWPLLYFPRVEI